MFNPTGQLFNILFLIFFLPTTSFGQTIETFTSSGTWICPAGITTVKVECWGGGGAGGSAAGNNSNAKRATAGGGAGGSYASSIIMVTEGASYSISVGAGGIAPVSSPLSFVNRQRSPPGLSSSISINENILVNANGGQGGLCGVATSSHSGANGGGVGNITGNIGDILFKGGNGSNSSSDVTAAGGYGGGGGSSASSTNNGISSNNRIGANAGAIGGGNGANGANFGTSNWAKSAAQGSGGGGGGGHSGQSIGPNFRGGNGGSGKVVLSYSAATLPVTLTSFYILREGIYNKLIWSTDVEINNLGFEIESSSDTRNYHKIGFVKSQAHHGNSSSEITYNFIDLSANGINKYYRLKQVDIDGKYKYSPIVKATEITSSTINIISCYPNPGKSNINFLIFSTTKEKIIMRIIDMSGKIQLNKSFELIYGKNTHNVDVSNLINRDYIVTLQNNSGDMLKLIHWCKL